MTFSLFSPQNIHVDYGYTLESPVLKSARKSNVLELSGSNEYPQFTWSKNQKIMYTHVIPNFTVRGSTLHRQVSMIYI